MVFKVGMTLTKRPENIRGNIPRNIYVQAYSRAIAESIVLLRKAEVEASPVGSTGLLRSSWVTDGPNVRGPVISGDVSSSEIQAIVIDQGADPHLPPSGEGTPLNQWVRKKLRITNNTAANTAAFLISRKIKKRGLPKKQTFTNTFKDEEIEFDKAMIRAKNRLVKRLGE